ncbi:MAG: AAC(3) family N-acetyltransferase [Cyclobacteriaceae bacterium]
MRPDHLISDQLNYLRIESSDVVLIHSALSAIGLTKNGADSFLGQLEAYFAHGLLLFPTHTWKYMDDPGFVFDPLTSPSCVGALTNLFLQRPDVYRSLHPTHSVAGKGIGAAEFVRGEEHSNTPCGMKGCWRKLYEKNAKIMFVGCSLKRNTIIHGAEEWNAVPNRLSKAPKVFSIKVSGSVIQKAYYTHDTPFDISENYAKILPELLKKGIAWEGTLGQAKTIVCQTAPMIDLVSQILVDDPNYFWTS